MAYNQLNITIFTYIDKMQDKKIEYILLLTKHTKNMKKYQNNKEGNKNLWNFELWINKKSSSIKHQESKLAKKKIIMKLVES